VNRQSSWRNLFNTHKNARRLLAFLARRKKSISPLLILTHDFPDPDSLASALALHYIAERHFGISARISYGGIVGRMENREMIRLLKIPVRKLRQGELKKYQHVALVDTQPEFENNLFPKKRRATIVIDQHQSVTTPNAVFSLVDTECGATSVVLAQALLVRKSDIPKKIATALAYGILSDTLDLYRAKRPDVIQTYLDIIHHSDLKVLARIQNPSRSKRFFASLGNAIRGAMVCKGLVVSHLGAVHNPDLIAQVAEFLITYDGARWSLCTGRFHGKLHVSLRMVKSNANAGELLRDVLVRRADAGGHGTIAGGSFKVGHQVSDAVWEEAEGSLIDKLLKRLRIAAKSQFKRPFSNGRT
jgi:nanoRNase/pAp phosphatase (c-di-AMP/oligoRNAs hydrolase)